MPSHSKKQHNFMEAIAHSPSFAKKVHIPQSVGKDYAEADKGRKFSKGGDMAGNTKAKKFRYGGDVVDEVSYDGSPSFGTEASLRRGRPLNARELRTPFSLAESPSPVEPPRPVEPPSPVEPPRPVEPSRPIPVELASPPRTGYKKGGEVAESKAMVKKEVEFFKKKGAPASMIKHEKAEMKGYKKGGSVDGCALRGKTKLKRGGSC